MTNDESDANIYTRQVIVTIVIIIMYEYRVNEYK